MQRGQRQRHPTDRQRPAPSLIRILISRRSSSSLHTWQPPLHGKSWRPSGQEGAPAGSGSGAGSGVWVLQWHAMACSACSGSWATPPASWGHCRSKSLGLYSMARVPSCCCMMPLGNSEAYACLPTCLPPMPACLPARPPACSAEWDEQHYFPIETLRKAADLGFGGMYVNEEVGGRW